MLGRLLGNYDRSWRTCWWKSTYDTLWHRHVKVYLLWILPGGMPSRRHRRGISITISQ